MTEWISCELHTHTVNSDGRLTLSHLCRKAKELGIDCIGLTDHNTISGHREISGAMRESGRQIIYGLEWTAFYGHMLALGLHQYVDWRDMGPGDIQKGIDGIHEAGGIAGVAHPFRVGSPICTGCYWQFEIKDWNCVDYLEVWSGGFSPFDYANTRAFAFWTELLNRGCAITAVSGRDWHGEDKECAAVTYLGLEKDRGSGFEKSAVHALSAGRSVVTMGPLIEISAAPDYDESQYSAGSKIIPDERAVQVKLAVKLDFSVRKGKWALDMKPVTILIDSNRGMEAQINIPYGSQEIIRVITIRGLKWLRARLYASMDGTEVMAAFTNPVFFRRD